MDATGLSAEQLKSVFPYHVVIDSTLTITQLGDKLEHLVHADRVTGTKIGIHFSFKKLSHGPWSWDSLLKHKDRSIQIYLNTDHNNYKKRFVNLSLKGRLLVVNGSHNPLMTPRPTKGIFLLDIDANCLRDLQENGLSLYDLSTYGSRKDLLLIGEQLRIERSSRRNYEGGAKKTIRSRTIEDKANRTKTMSELKRTFVRYLSHEMRTPLNVMCMGLHHLEASNCLNSNPQCAEVVNEMQRSCEAAVRVLDDMLICEEVADDLSRLVTEEVKIEKLANAAVCQFKAAASVKDVNLTSDLSLADDLLASVDPEKYSLVLRSVLSNAIKFTPSGGRVKVTASILGDDLEEGSKLCRAGVSDIDLLNLWNWQSPSPSRDLSRRSRSPLRSLSNSRHSVSFCDSVSSTSPSSPWWLDESIIDQVGSLTAHSSTPAPYTSKYLRISVCDSGPGIPQSELAHLFQQFAHVRGGDDQGPDRGSGLNLWLAHTVMKALGGHISVENNHSDSGCTFYIDVPIAQLDACQLTDSGMSTKCCSETDQVTEDDSSYCALADQAITDRDNGRDTSRPCSVSWDLEEDAYYSSSGCVDITVPLSSKGIRSSRHQVPKLTIPTTTSPEREIVLGSLRGRCNLGPGSSSNKHPPTSRRRPSYNHAHIVGNLGLSAFPSEVKDKDKERLDGPNSNKSPRTATAYTSNTHIQNPQSTSTKGPHGHPSSSKGHGHCQSGSSKSHNNSSSSRPFHSLLIVDDSATTRRMVQRVLQKKFRRVEEAKDGFEGVSRAMKFLAEKGAPYDVIMMDFVMPEMDGPAAVKELRQSGYNGLIIGVTGNSQQDDINAFLGAGVDRVMMKPLDVEQFVTHVREAKGMQI